MVVNIALIIAAFSLILAPVAGLANDTSKAQSEELTAEEASRNLPKNSPVPLAKPPEGYHPNGFKIGSKSDFTNDLSPAGLKTYDECMKAEDDFEKCKKSGLAVKASEEQALQKKLDDYKLCVKEIDDVKICSEKVGLPLEEIIQKLNEKQP